MKTQRSSSRKHKTINSPFSLDVVEQERNDIFTSPGAEEDQTTLLAQRIRHPRRRPEGRHIRGRTCRLWPSRRTRRKTWRARRRRQHHCWRRRWRWPEGFSRLRNNNVHTAGSQTCAYFTNRILHNSKVLLFLFQLKKDFPFSNRGYQNPRQGRALQMQ